MQRTHNGRRACADGRAYANPVERLEVRVLGRPQFRLQVFQARRGTAEPTHGTRAAFFAPTTFRYHGKVLDMNQVNGKLSRTQILCSIILTSLPWS